MTRFSIFVVDDEQVARDGVALALEKEYAVKTFEDAESALNALRRDRPDLILLDIGLPGISGIEALSRIKQRCPDILVIMITAYEDVESVVASMKLGAYDYILKPLQMNPLMVTIKNALINIELRKEVRHLQERYLKENLPIIIGKSNAIQEIMEVVEKVAQSPDTPVLITGETGTGKELIARSIHYHSPNFKGPLVNVNCAAIPKELIESELFGHEKGAFTGASVSGKEGMVEKAAGGTLFLDEVADLSPEAQAKLLRFLERGEYYRVGSTKVHTVQTRVVSATNRNLEKMIDQEQFRRDLFYRLAVINIEVPTLNERREDILPIAKHFLLEFNCKFGKSFVRFSPETEDALVRFRYTGNIRELKNLIERQALLLNGTVMTIPEINMKPHETPQTSNFDALASLLPRLNFNGIDFPGAVMRIEKRYFRDALDLTNGNETQAARLLGLSRDAFRYRKKSHQ